MLAEGRGKLGSFPEMFNDTFFSRPFNRRLVTYVLIIFSRF